MSLSNLAMHGAEAIKRANENNSGNKTFTNEKIWFDWGKKEEHVIRLVGDFKWIRTHWIGESKYGKDVPILNASAFNGENKIPMSVACGNWSPDTETEDPDGGGCPICRLGKNADEALAKYGKDMDEDDRNILKSIRKKCAVKNTYLFKCIDRENPFVDENKTKKGYKIIKIPAALLSAIIEISKQFAGVNITSPEEGIDIIIKRTQKDAGVPTFTALPVMQGMSVKQTPLTKEELEYHDIDLSKFTGKPVDFERFEQELVEENNVRALYENKTEEVDGENAPF